MTITYEYGGSLYVNMTNKCSNNCNFCIRNNSRGSIYAENLWYESEEPTREKMLADIAARPLAEYREIVFCGYGEPACRWDDMLWLSARIKELGKYKIRLNTNGQANLICGRDTTPEMEGLFDTLSVSLCAHNAQAYDALCHSRFGPSAFEGLLTFTRGSIAYVPKVVMTVVNTLPPHEIAQCKTICESLGAIFRVRTLITT